MYHILNYFYLYLVLWNKEYTMSTIIVKRKISSSILRIAELKRFLGKHVEIIVKEQQKPEIDKEKKSVAGALKKFADQNKKEKEHLAWQNAIKDKHGNH